MTADPIDLYFDQMVLSEAAHVGNWRNDHYLGTLIAPLVSDGRVRVRPSLAHFSETVLYVDVDEEHGCTLRETDKLDVRQRMAKIACELSDLEHPIPRWEVLAVDELAKAIGALVPSAIDFVAVEELRRLDREWLRSKLARLAANRTEHDPRFYEHAWRGKLVTQLAQAECRDPEYLDALLNDLKAPQKVTHTPYDLLDQLPLPQLRALVRARIQELSALDASGARRRWQKHRQQLEAIYTAERQLDLPSGDNYIAPSLDA
jgi:hypothetical protein